MFIEPPEDVSVAVSMSAMFVCSVTGQPRPIVTWLVEGGEEVSESSTISINETTPDDDEFAVVSVLMFLSTSLDDTDTYVCSAVNEDGTITASTTLNVMGMSVGRFYC